MNDIKTFHILRENDESGVSGTGRVLNGVVFPSGKTVIHWAVEGKPNSVAIYDTYEGFYEIHIGSHPSNNTEVVFHE